MNMLATSQYHATQVIKNKPMLLQADQAIRLQYPHQIKLIRYIFKDITYISYFNITAIIFIFKFSAGHRLAGYSLYVSNSSISKTDGYLCYHDEGPGLPSVYQDRNCNHLGQYVIIYNERNVTSSYNPAGYSPKAVLELCEVEIYGK